MALNVRTHPELYLDVHDLTAVKLLIHQCHYLASEKQRYDADHEIEFSEVLKPQVVPEIA